MNTGFMSKIPRWGRWTVKLGREQWPIQNSPLLKVGSGETLFGLMFFVDNLQGVFFYWFRPKSSKYGTGSTQYTENG